jgi:hypothetical protein
VGCHCGRLFYVVVVIGGVVACVPMVALGATNTLSGVWPRAAHCLIMLGLSGVVSMNSGDGCFNGGRWVLAVYCFASVLDVVAVLVGWVGINDCIV